MSSGAVRTWWPVTHRTRAGREANIGSKRIVLTSYGCGVAIHKIGGCIGSVIQTVDVTLSEEVTIVRNTIESCLPPSGGKSGVHKATTRDVNQGIECFTVDIILI